MRMHNYVIGVSNNVSGKRSTLSNFMIVHTDMSDDRHDGPLTVSAARLQVLTVELARS